MLPALKKFRDFVDRTYLPGARETIGMSALPDGAAWYAMDARNSTTTNLTPREIHELGKKEVARIEVEMAALRKALGFQGDKKAFGEFLRNDPRFIYKSADELLAGYRDICKRIDPELPRLFGRLPRLTYGVKPVPDYAADAKPTAYYEPGSPEAGRAGFFFANTVHLDQRPKWQMEVLALHVAVPGIICKSRSRRSWTRSRAAAPATYTAFIEGWALYCEGLGKEMGCYSDPYSDYGRLNFEIWRAVRLVVDTGIHALGWSREQAIDYFREHTAMSDYNIKVEVDRYIVWPGQALAYKIGQLKISELRRRARLRWATDSTSANSTTRCSGRARCRSTCSRSGWTAGLRGKRRRNHPPTGSRLRHEPRTLGVSTILLILLVLLIIGALPSWPYSSGWGYYPSGGLGLILVIVLVLLLLRVI